MATLYGQNFRVWMNISPTADRIDYRVIGASTNCTVNLTANAADTTHKDILGIFGRPDVVSRSGTVTVESLFIDNSDFFLKKILNREPMLIRWDESLDNGTMNQLPVEASGHRCAMAYVTDFTLAANNRENCTVSATFTLASEPAVDSDIEWSDEDTFTQTKGQKVRLLINPSNGFGVIAAALNLQFHISVSTENSTTKDTVSDWEAIEPTSISYDLSCTALIRSGELITSQERGYDIEGILEMFASGSQLPWELAEMNGANNRAVGRVMVSGDAICTSVTLNGPNRQKATVDLQMQGVGPYQLPS